MRAKAQKTSSGCAGVRTTRWSSNRAPPDQAGSVGSGEAGLVAASLQRQYLPAIQQGAAIPSWIDAQLGGIGLSPGDDGAVVVALPEKPLFRLVWMPL